MPAGHGAWVHTVISRRRPVCPSPDHGRRRT